MITVLGKRERENVRGTCCGLDAYGMMRGDMHASFLRRLGGPSLIIAGVCLMALAGCSKRTASEPASGAGSAHHEHVAPHGGTLIELGEHQFNLELVHEPAESRLTAYVLDAHADDFVRLPIQGFALIALVNGRRESLPMAAQANSATGEVAGDTSAFAATAPWLSGRVAFDAYIPAIDVGGTTFKDVRFAFRSPAAQP